MKIKRFLIIIALFLVACEGENPDSQTGTEEKNVETIDIQSSEENEALYDNPNLDMNYAHYLEMMHREEPVWAGVSHSDSFGHINQNFFVEIEDSEDLTFLVEEMVEGSERSAGIVDISEPNYGLRIEYENGYTEDFHLWITEEHGENNVGTIMDSRNTNFVYTFPISVSDRFVSLFPENEI